MIDRSKGLTIAIANDHELVMVTGDSKLGSAAQSIGISVAFTAT